MRSETVATYNERVVRFSDQQEQKKWERTSKNKKQFIGCASVYPNAFHIYNVPENGYDRTIKFTDNFKNLRAEKKKGELSDKARKRIENAIQWLLLKSQPKHIWNRQQQKSMFFRLNFITCTLAASQIHSDAEIVKVCLNNFLNVLRKNGLTDYVWRAEAQENGRIHFHITTNTYFHFSDINRWWNQSQELLGYVSRFEMKLHHRNPPSAQIRKVKHIRKLASYLSKYMAKEKSFNPVGELRLINGKKVEVFYDSQVYKNEDASKKTGVIIGTVLSQRLRKVDARLWACSQSISKSKPLRFDQSCPQWDAIKTLSRDENFYCRKGDYVDSYYGSVVNISRKKSPGLYEDLIQHAKGYHVNLLCSDDKVLQYLEPF